MIGLKNGLLKIFSEPLAVSVNPNWSDQVLDWEYFKKVTGYHSIGPLLYHNLKMSGNCVPEKVMEHLKEQYFINSVRNEFYFDKLRQIQEAFKENGIEMIVMKGAALASTVYDDKDLRPFSDIDLLIRKKELNEAEDILIGLGYVLDVFATPRKFSLKYDYHLRYEMGTAKIELHWDVGLKSGINKYMGINYEKIRKNAIKTKITGIDMLIPSLEDMIIHTCIHAARHRYLKSIWLYDIKKISEHQQIDWAYITITAKSTNTSYSVHYALNLTEELFGYVFNRKMLEELRPPEFEINLFWDILSWKTFCIFDLVKDMTLRLLLIDRNKDRLKFLLTYPCDALLYFIFSNKKRTFSRLRRNITGL